MEPLAAYPSALQIDSGFIDKTTNSATFQQIFSTSSLDDESQPLIFTVKLNF